MRLTWGGGAPGGVGSAFADYDYHAIDREKTMTTKNRKHFAEAFDPLDDALLEADQAEGIIDHVIDEVSRPLDDRGEDYYPQDARVKRIEGLI
jgi:hypothetical protein